MLKRQMNMEKFISMQNKFASGGLDPVSLIAGRNGYTWPL